MRPSHAEILESLAVVNALKKSREGHLLAVSYLSQCMRIFGEHPKYVATRAPHLIPFALQFTGKEGHLQSRLGGMGDCCGRLYKMLCTGTGHKTASTNSCLFPEGKGPCETLKNCRSQTRLTSFSCPQSRPPAGKGSKTITHRFIGSNGFY